MKKKILVLIVLLLVLAPFDALAGVFEISTGFSFNKSNYGGGSFTWTRRWGASVSYHFTEKSGVEISYQNVVDRNFIIGVEDTTYTDQILSVNWIQTFLEKESVFQPFVKLGIGQLFRDIQGTYAGGASLPLQINSVTGVIAIGCKIFVLKNIAIRTEVTSYLKGGSLATWQDNIGVTLGGSFFF